MNTLNTVRLRPWLSKEEDERYAGIVNADFATPHTVFQTLPFIQFMRVRLLKCSPVLLIFGTSG